MPKENDSVAPCAKNLREHMSDFVQNKIRLGKIVF